MELRTQRDWERILEAEGMPAELPMVTAGLSVRRHKANADVRAMASGFVMEEAAYEVVTWRCRHIAFRLEVEQLYFDRARAYFWEQEAAGWESWDDRRVWGLHCFNGLTEQQISERMAWPSARTPAAHGGWSPGAQRVHLVLSRHREAAGLTRARGLLGPRRA